MSTQPKPSAGALRAADAVLQWNGTGYIPVTRIELAKLIEAESGLAELLEACKALLDYDDDPPDPGTFGAEVYARARAAIAKATTNPNAETVQALWADSGFYVPDELCALPTPLQVMQPLLQQVQIDRNPDADKIWPKQTHHARCALRSGGDCDCLALGYRHVDPPIARQAHLQEMIRGLKRDRDMYRKLLEDTERNLAEYEVMAGQVPF